MEAKEIIELALAIRKTIREIGSAGRVATVADIEAAHGTAGLRTLRGMDKIGVVIIHPYGEVEP